MLLRRSIIHFVVVTLSAVVLAGAVGTRPSMKPTAPQKMMTPNERQKMQECQKKAAQRNIAMHERAKFLMDCMIDKAK
jgi:hypothetical protein